VYGLFTGSQHPDSGRREDAAANYNLGLKTVLHLAIVLSCEGKQEDVKEMRGRLLVLLERVLGKE
jgi:hypothetical protein